MYRYQLFYKKLIINEIMQFANEQGDGKIRRQEDDPRIAKTIRAISVSWPREWNIIPASIRQCTSVAQFKSK